MNKCTVYALCEPNTLNIRYVGQTTWKPSFRLTKHIHNALKAKRPNHLYCWIRKLDKNNKKPNMIILQYNADWNVDEIFWIQHFKDCGFDLVNHTDGGKGILGYKHTNKAKKKIGKASMGNKYALGYKQTKETKDKRIKTRSWYKPSKETKDKIAKKHKKKVQCIETGEIFDSEEEACFHNGVCKGSICNNIKGRSMTSAGYTWRYL